MTPPSATVPTALDDHLAAYESTNPYDFDNGIVLTWYPQRVLQHAAGAGSLLELGVGHGHATDAFARRFARHVVLEGSPAVIANFRTRFPGCAAAITATFFETFDTDERFDVITLGFVLEHVDDPAAILARYRRFLAPGGRMFIAVPNAEVLNRRLGHIAGMLDDMTTLSDNDRRLGHQRYYTLAGLKAEIAGAGLRLKRVEGIYLKPFTSRQIVSLQLDAKLIEALCTVGIAYPELCCAILAEASAS